MLFAGEMLIRTKSNLSLAPFLVAFGTSCLLPDLRPLQGSFRHQGSSSFQRGENSLVQVQQQ